MHETTDTSICYCGCRRRRYDRLRGHQRPGDTGQYVDDATITTRVKTRFAKDPTVSAMRINVETMKGVVQLSGNAKSQAERDQAAQLASSVPGVTKVENHLRVESATSDSNSNNR